jgi:proteasome lid subunit RPN8/RPN11
VPANRDWETAHEWARFYSQRRNELPLDANGSASVLPLWERTLGEPYCRGYRVEIARPGRRPVSSDFPSTHFRDLASAAASLFVERQQLRAGDSYSYLVVAHPAPPEAPKLGGLAVANASPRVPAGDALLAPFLARVQRSGAIDDDDMPVFVSRQVLQEAAERTHAERGTETGGILIGMLWRDAAAGEIFAEVTAQIPAEHTSGNNVKLTFTPQTWAAADAALRLRRRGESYLGYWHSHPVRAWCREKDCTPEKQKSCRLAKDFFSADDEAVMRAAFPRAYSIAIVANDTAFTELTFSMFGNREGLVQPRGFYVLEEKASGT